MMSWIEAGGKARWIDLAGRNVLLSWFCLMVSIISSGAKLPIISMFIFDGW
jgi:hypothetical protein